MNHDELVSEEALTLREKAENSEGTMYPDFQVLALIKEVRALRDQIKNQHGMGHQ